MENTIEHNGKTLNWDYDICPCRQCPIYPTKNEWEYEKDIRKDKCYTSRCTYQKELATNIAWGLHKWRTKE